MKFLINDFINHEIENNENQIKNIENLNNSNKKAIDNYLKLYKEL